jgi:hypothetical protein
MASSLDPPFTPQRITTEEMLGWLRKKRDIPEELGEAVLTAWVGALSHAVLNHAEQDERFLRMLGNGEATLSLSAGLAPEGWRDEDLWAQVAQQTGLGVSEGQELLGDLAERFKRIAGGRIDFVPVGLFEPVDSGEAGFTVHCRKDFLLPKLDDPAELVYGGTRRPFANKVPQSYDEMTLDQARLLLSSNGAPLVSIKVRPLQYWPIDSDEDFRHGYVHDVDYEAIDSFLADHFTAREPSQLVPRGSAKAYTSNDTAEFLFVRHESGPEIIARFGAAEDSPVLLNSVLEVVRATMMAVKRSNEAWKSQGEDSGRHYPVAAISIEERREKGAHILTVVHLAFDESDLEDMLRGVLTPALG